MSRIPTIEPHAANVEQAALFNAIEAKLGGVPNFLKVLANSPSALKAFLGLYLIAEEGDLDPQTRERIALSVAEFNACEYCVSAHTAIGRKAGLTHAEIVSNRSGSSQDAKAAVAVSLARSLVKNMGELPTQELIYAREAGYSNAELVEIITHVGLNIITNLIGKASRVEIDFPKVALLPA